MDPISFRKCIRIKFDASQVVRHFRNPLSLNFPLHLISRNWMDGSPKGVYSVCTIKLEKGWNKYATFYFGHLWYRKTGQDTGVCFANTLGLADLLLIPQPKQDGEWGSSPFFQLTYYPTPTVAGYPFCLWPWSLCLEHQLFYKKVQNGYGPLLAIHCRANPLKK